MKCNAVIFASKEHGMDLQFASKALLPETSKLKNTFLQYVTNELEHEGFLFHRYTASDNLDYYVIGKITRIPFSEYDSRPTNIHHYYFFTKEEFDMVVDQAIAGQALQFFSTVNKEIDFSKSEKLTFKPLKDHLAGVRPKYMKNLFTNFYAIFDNVFGDKVYIDWDAATDITYESWFFYLLASFDFCNSPFDSIRFGIKCYVGEEAYEMTNQKKLVLSKDWEYSASDPDNCYTDMIQTPNTNVPSLLDTIEEFHLLSYKDRERELAQLKKSFLDMLTADELYIALAKKLYRELRKLDGLKPLSRDGKRIRLLKKTLQNLADLYAE